MVALSTYLVAAFAAAAHCLPILAKAPRQAPPDAPPSVPIAVGGKEADISIEFIALMLPEYDGISHLILPHTTPPPSNPTDVQQWST